MSPDYEVTVSSEEEERGRVLRVLRASRKNCVTSCQCSACVSDVVIVDALTTAIERRVLAQQPCCGPFCSLEGVEGAYRGWWREPGSEHWFADCGKCPSCTARQTQEATDAKKPRTDDVRGL